MKNILTVAACATVLWAGTVLATPTAQQSCDYARITAWKKYQYCVDGVVAKEALPGSLEDFKAFWKCRHAYFRKWAGFQGKATYATSSCDQTTPAIGGRFADNGDQTVTDNLSGLVWEKKDNTGGVHDKDNYYTWSTGSPYPEDGTVFTTFLTGPVTGLNVAGFAGASGWRLPTLAELQSIVLDFACTGEGLGPTCRCPSSPCVNPPLDAATALSDPYWSASTVAYVPISAQTVEFYYGAVGRIPKAGYIHVRAVRGGL